MDIVQSVIVAVISYLFGCFGFRRVLVALSMVSRNNVALPVGSFLLWMAIMIVPYLLVNKLLSAEVSSLFVGYFAAILVEFRKLHSDSKKK